MHEHEATTTALETRQIGRHSRHRPTLVFLHEGLGSVSMWRDFPDRLCRQTQLAGLVYSREGYGQSPPQRSVFEPSFMHQAAIDELPALLAAHELGNVILIGHSDGASIALIRAGMQPPSLAGVVALAPHLFVEPICTQAISAITNGWHPESALAKSLQRHHEDGERTFRRWSQAWLDPRFADWNIEAEVARIQCPVLAIQGHDDQYGTMRQIDRIRELHADTELLKLARCGHIPHAEQTLTVLNRVRAFIARLHGAKSD